MDELLKAFETIKEFCKSRIDCQECPLRKFCYISICINPDDWDLDVIRIGIGEQMNGE